MITMAWLKKDFNKMITIENMTKYLVLTILLVASSIVHAAEYDATLTWAQRVEMSAPVNGVVQKVFAQTGKIAAKGETLVQIDPRGFNASLKYAKAKFKSAEVNAQEAKRELDRQSDMYDRTMLSDHDLQIAKNNHVEALSRLQQAESELTQAKLNVEYSAIRAPFNAIIVETKAVKGQVVTSDITPPVLVVVAEAHRMLARTYVKADKVNSLVLNQGAVVKVAGKTFQGKVTNIGMEMEHLKPGLYVVDIIFDTKDAVLRAGLNAKVEL
jgi:multidrug efflux system membrane fusion protein